MGPVVDHGLLMVMRDPTVGLWMEEQGLAACLLQVTCWGPVTDLLTGHLLHCMRHGRHVVGGSEDDHSLFYMHVVCSCIIIAGSTGCSSAKQTWIIELC
jgi:hypothetical protein